MILDLITLLRAGLQPGKENDLGNFMSPAGIKSFEFPECVKLKRKKAKEKRQI